MTQNVYPVLRFRDAPAAIEWLVEALGFERQEVHAADDGTVHHAQLLFEGGMVMLGSAGDGSDRRRERSARVWSTSPPTTSTPCGSG